jgi:putative lipoprotein
MIGPRAATLVAWASIFAIAESAHAADPDPFFAPDKALHFAVSAGIAGGAYGMTTALTDDRWKAFALGGGAALAVGAVKEAYDATGPGDPSWKDFAWDAIGAAVGLAIAWGIDAAVQGKVPPMSASTASGGALRF